MAGLLHDLEKAGGIEKSRVVDRGDIAPGEELYGNVGVRDMVRELGDDQDIERIDREESRVHGAAEGFDGGTYGGEAVVIFKDAYPGGTGVANLMTEVGHGDLFPGKGISRKD